MNWATQHIEKLKAGEAVTFRPTGGSMSPIIESGQLVTVQPLTRDPIVGEIVLCQVGKNQYLHLVKQIDVDKAHPYLIGNNKGGNNGWIGKEHIFGTLVRVDGDKPDPNLKLRSIVIGACSTLDRAASMRDLLRQAVLDIIEENEALKRRVKHMAPYMPGPAAGESLTDWLELANEEADRLRAALEHIAAGNLSPNINFAKYILQGMTVEEAHKKQVKDWGDR